MLRDSKEKFPTRLWVLLPKLSVRFIVCKQKRVVRVKDHKSVLSCFHVKIDLTDEQMDFKYWQMGNEIKRIRIRVVPRSKIDFVSKRMCNFKSISSETEFFFAKTRRKILCSCKGRMLCKLLGIAYIADICFANKEDKSSAPAKSSRICFANKED